MVFTEYNFDTDKIEFFRWKGKTWGSSILIDHKSIFHFPPKMDIWRYEGYLDKEFVVEEPKLKNFVVKE